MRLLGLSAQQNQLSEEEQEDLENQKHFARILDHIGNGTHPQSINDEFDGTVVPQLLLAPPKRHVEAKFGSLE